MTANLEWTTILNGIRDWVQVFGSILGIVLLIAFLVSLVAAGLSGPRLVLRHIFGGRKGGKAVWIGGVLGAVLGADLGWSTGPATIQNLYRMLQWQPQPGLEMTGAIACAVLCGLLGVVIGAITAGAAADCLDASFRRIWALAILTVKESWSRKLAWVFVVFIVVFMFASWFLPEEDFRADLQVKNYISTALFPTTWLPIVVVVLLSCWGLPEDIKNRSMHTVVTKPVRRTEVLLGRVLGLSLIGTGMLVVMGLVGYIWIKRQVPPEAAQEHLICRVPIQGSLQFTDRMGNPTTEGINVGDEDASRLYIEGGTRSKAIWTFRGISEEDLGDVVELESRLRAFRLHKGDTERSLLGQVRLVKRLRERSALFLAAPQAFLAANQHLRNGLMQNAAVALQTVGDGAEKGQIGMLGYELGALEIGYSRFAGLLGPVIEKRPEAAWLEDLAAAARNVSAEAGNRQVKGLGTELKAFAQIFRDHAEELETILVDVVADLRPFRVREYGQNNIIVNSSEIRYRVGDNPEMIEGDLYEDIVHGNELQVEVVCLDTGQFLGMAQPDLFIRAKDNSFELGYAKTLLGVWMMVVLIILFGVTASCFVKGPVGMLLITTLLVIGSVFHGTLERIVTGDMKGGGALESIRRIVEQVNPQIQYEVDTGLQAIRTFDQTLTGGLWVVHKIIPNFQKYSMSRWIAEGFDVPLVGAETALIPAFLMTLAYFLPCLLLGHYSLRYRELESK